jgi:hypothetical protein
MSSNDRSNSAARFVVMPGDAIGPEITAATPYVQVR